MSLARASLESLLREKRLDITLSHLRPPVEGRPPLPVGQPDIDLVLGGGLPRGELSEMAGPRSSGKTTLMCAALVAATRRGELAALVDALDRFDVASAAAAGIECTNLLWVRGIAASVEAIGGSRGAQAGHASLWRAVERAVKAFTLVLESRAFGLAVCDLADVPVPLLRRLPFTTWFRLARLIEGGTTAAVVVAPERLGRSAGGITIALGEEPSQQWRGTSDRARLFDGMVPRARVVGRR